MSSSSLVAEVPTAKAVRISAGKFILDLCDGRSLSVPLSWYPRLADATLREHRNWELIGRGIGVHWPDLDEDISVEAVLAGLGSNESSASLRRWRASRRRPGL